MERLAALLVARGETLAVAETAAGGLISATLLGVPGASAWFLGGAVAYSAQAKQAWLALPPGALGGHGSVSAPAAQALARAVQAQLGATWGLAETGIAGPQTRRRSSKPAGLVYLAVAGRVARVVERRTALGDRSANQRAFADAALDLLLEALAAAGEAP